MNGAIEDVWLSFISANSTGHLPFLEILCCRWPPTVHFRIEKLTLARW